jgi:hypothetical protein
VSTETGEAHSKSTQALERSGSQEGSYAEVLPCDRENGTTLQPNTKTATTDERSRRSL